MVNTENTNNLNEAVMRFPFLFLFFYYLIHLYPLTSRFWFFKLMQSIKITQSNCRNQLRYIFLHFFFRFGCEILLFIEFFFLG